MPQKKEIYKNFEFESMDDSFESEMMSILPIMLLADEEQRRRDERLRRFVPITVPLSTGPSAKPTNDSLSNTLLRALETGRFTDVQFQVGVDGFCFNCHKAIVGARSEVLAIAMEHRWTENCSENNFVLDKTVIRLPETDVGTFKVFLKVGPFCFCHKFDKINQFFISLQCSTCTAISLI